MIKEEQLDSPLAVICFHNVGRNQDFDTDWISDMTNEQIREMVLLLNAYGYITYKEVLRDYHTAYLCKITSEGIKFSKSGGFKELEKNKKRKKTKIIGTVIAIIASLATIAAFIFQLLSK